jgi:catabolite regulation protein CreA
MTTPRCQVSRAICRRAHGWVQGTIGVAEDRSRFSIACRQVGPITVDLGTLPKEEEAFSERTSIFFKRLVWCVLWIERVGLSCTSPTAQRSSKGPLQ